MKKRYAVIAKLRMQVSGFVNNTNVVVGENALIVDMLEHPQKDEVEVDWFYNEEKNSFSKEGTVTYPIPTPKPEPEFTQTDRIEAATEYLMAMQE